MGTSHRVRAAAALSALGLGCSVGALVAAGPADAAVATPAAASASACGLGRWEAAVQGAPRFAAGDRGGDYLWHTAAGFRLRVTHRGDHRDVYTGEITADAALHLSPVHLERGDVVRLSADHRTIVFAFVDHGYIDGVDFTTDCAAQVAVSHLDVGNEALPVDRVQLGVHKVHPATVPFTIVR